MVCARPIKDAINARSVIERMYAEAGRYGDGTISERWLSSSRPVVIFVKILVETLSRNGYTHGERYRFTNVRP
jgi:hypothetical protein